MDRYRGVDVKSLRKEFKPVVALTRQVSQGSKAVVNSRTGTKPVVNSNMGIRPADSNMAMRPEDSNMGMGPADSNIGMRPIITTSNEEASC